MEEADSDEDIEGNDEDDEEDDEEIDEKNEAEDDAYMARLSREAAKLAVSTCMHPLSQSGTQKQIAKTRHQVMFGV